MALRETLRGYVQQINTVAAETGLLMLRPIFLAFPEDLVLCAQINRPRRSSCSGRTGSFPR